MKTLLYIIRHGESMGNMRHQFLGHTDLSLSDLGREQAIRCGAYLKEMSITPDVVYASPLKRAYETAALAIRPQGRHNITVCEGVQEIYAGKWEGMLFEEIAEQYPQEMHTWRNDIGNAHPTEGEQVSELYHRTVKAFLSIAAKHEGQTVLIGTHATPVRSFESYARGVGIKGMKDIPWPFNASLSVYLCEGEQVIPLCYSLNSYLGDVDKRPVLQ